MSCIILVSAGCYVGIMCSIKYESLRPLTSSSYIRIQPVDRASPWYQSSGRIGSELNIGYQNCIAGRNSRGLVTANQKDTRTNNCTNKPTNYAVKLAITMLTRFHAFNLIVVSSYVFNP